MPMWIVWEGAEEELAASGAAVREREGSGGGAASGMSFSAAMLELALKLLDKTAAAEEAVVMVRFCA